MPLLDPDVASPPFADLGDSLLERLIRVGHDATETHANAFKSWTEADIEFDRAHDEAYRKSTATTHAAKDRDAAMNTRDASEKRKRAKADEVAADRRARFALAALSAMQTQARLEGGQT